MEIILESISKRYNKEWVFRQLDTHLKLNRHTAILGRNGSGKSTLLQIIAGFLQPSAGKVIYFANGKALPDNGVFKYISICAPYLELIEEFTLAEQIKFHRQFKSLLPGLDEKEIAEKLMIEKALDKQIRHYSSGMKQRVKLGFAILSATPVVLLDEPHTNLDRYGVVWYEELVKHNRKDRLFIICSNHNEKEYFFCNESIMVEEYKNKR